MWQASPWQRNQKSFPPSHVGRQARYFLIKPAQYKEPIHAASVCIIVIIKAAALDIK